MSKRFVAVLLALVSCCCVAVGCSSHTHEYGDAVSIGETQHKKVCSCGESVSEDHDFDDGEITTKPTTTSKGVMTYKCNDCGHTYTADIDKIDATVSENEWEKAMDLRTVPYKLFETITDQVGKTSTSTVKYNVDKVYQAKTSTQPELQGVVIAEVFYYVEGDKCFSVTGQIGQDGGMVYKKRETTVANYETLKNITNYAIKFPQENFVYDAENCEYRFTGSLKVDGYDVTDATIRFENGKLVYIETFRTAGAGTLHNIMQFTYGEQQIDVPQVELE